MADDADLTQARIEREMDGLLRRRPSAPPPCGACLWCEAPLPAQRRWCDADCRDAWQRFEERAHARQARR
ncbi:hypothetical protein Talka_00945 [Tepidimonas alkaliphilus]|uniref:DUF2116 family Zn-ribbon domain-containing protein n=1 Tax=Tepidimonas alkaliphilus TaxID=2588942 RepID=A0A554WAI8_9BURK|nr:hypothetical protein [Tepidimonas alkaliphilus]TSE20593.1 hypothetical protein Talka_00945 [Tepidimonas alkaliphilus]